MKLHRLLLAGIILSTVAGLAYVSQKDSTVEERMATAGEKLVASLSPDQKAKAVLDFESKERINWNFVPMQTADRKPTRKGLPLEEMTAAQKKLALELLRAGTSDRGYTTATTIMSLEALLKELEKGGSMVRNPEWYFVTIFGTPSRNGKWGWRIEGHHLSLNFTLDKGKVIGATPAFFGANPALVMAGPRKGLETLPDAVKLAKDLYAALDEDQKKVALQAKQFPEIEQAKAKPNVGAPVGIPADKLTDKQRRLLVQLVDSYARRMPAEIAEAELKRVQEAGVGKIHFAFAQETNKPGKPYTYRVHGPTFVIEFLNVQADSARNPANHIHSSWRNLDGDFGMSAK